uniref:G-protein coupled receptors family 1 profile domain-containing protein n=1 Tax=Amphilophus citrinellus TaxID=61819 RepID=A0A3Q0RCM3_AMPCI
MSESCRNCSCLIMEIQNGVELCFPQFLNSSCRKPTLNWSKRVLLNTVLSFISLMTAVLNLLVIISVSHFRQLHTPSNIILLSLAVSDFLVGLLLMPVEIYRNSTCWVLGDSMCSLYSYLNCNIVTASIGNIVLISVDRYVAICDPLHYPTRITAVRTKLSVCLCWLYAKYLGSDYRELIFSKVFKKVFKKVSGLSSLFCDCCLYFRPVPYYPT